MQMHVRDIEKRRQHADWPAHGTAVCVNSAAETEVRCWKSFGRGWMTGLDDLDRLLGEGRE